MERAQLNQWTILVTEQESILLFCSDAFLIDQKAQNLSMGAVSFYYQKLKCLPLTVKVK